MTSRISFKVTGTVQGVNFRYATVKEARRSGITGFVQNEPDGSVTGEAQGDSSSLKSFVQFLHRGPSAARVQDVQQSEISNKDGETGFGQH